MDTLIAQLAAHYLPQGINLFIQIDSIDVSGGQGFSGTAHDDGAKHTGTSCGCPPVFRISLGGLPQDPELFQDALDELEKYPDIPL